MKLFFILNISLVSLTGQLEATTPPSSNNLTKSDLDSDRSVKTSENGNASDSENLRITTPLEPSSNTSEDGGSGDKSGSESESFFEDSSDEVSPKKSAQEPGQWIMLKELNGIKYIFNDKSKRWVQAYSGLIDGNWKELEKGVVLPRELEKKAKNERRRQGIRSPYTDFAIIEDKNFGLDRAKKEWVEIDYYSFPLENGKRIAYTQETLIK